MKTTPLMVRSWSKVDALLTRSRLFWTPGWCLPLAAVIGLSPVFRPCEEMFPGSQCDRFQRLPMGLMGNHTAWKHWSAEPGDANWKRDSESQDGPVAPALTTALLSRAL